MGQVLFCWGNKEVFYLASTNTQVLPYFLAPGSWAVVLMSKTLSGTGVCIEPWFCVTRSSGSCDSQRCMELMKDVWALSSQLPSRQLQNPWKAADPGALVTFGRSRGRQTETVWDRTAYSSLWSNEHVEQTVVEEVVGGGILTMVKIILEEHIYPCWHFAHVSWWNFQRRP